jgi:hypothetical protein
MAARSMRREDKEYSDHERHQGHVALAAIRQISGNRRGEQARNTSAGKVQREASGNRRVEQARDTAARQVQREVSENRRVG